MMTGSGKGGRRERRKNEIKEGREREWGERGCNSLGQI